MSKMGVCTFSGYCGAQLFEILGLDASTGRSLLPGHARRQSAASTLADIAATVLDAPPPRVRAARAGARSIRACTAIRRDGEYHATNPLVVRGLQKARDEAPAATHRPTHETFKSHVYGRPPQAIRDLLEFAPAAAPVALDAGRTGRRRSAAASSRRRCRSARCRPRRTARSRSAMNRLGARSNSGEGGEEPDRFAAPSGDGTAAAPSRSRRRASA